MYLLTQPTSDDTRFKTEGSAWSVKTTSLQPFPMAGWKRSKAMESSAELHFSTCFRLEGQGEMDSWMGSTFCLQCAGRQSNRGSQKPPVAPPTYLGPSGED